jgi:hypothetical protein
VSLEKGKEFKDISSDDHPGKWKVVFFWPKDFHLRLSDGDRRLRQAQTATSRTATRRCWA